MRRPLVVATAILAPLALSATPANAAPVLASCGFGIYYGGTLNALACTPADLTVGTGTYDVGVVNLLTSAGYVCTALVSVQPVHNGYTFSGCTRLY
jgi:hypothetical protein